MARTLRLGLLCLTAAVLASAFADPEDTFIGARANYWAFQKPARPAVPATHDKFVRSPVDAFILDALRAKNLSPSPPLDRVRLIRRVTLDLTGLPPTPAEVAAFLADRSPGAYEKVVDRLIASPQYGERWALKWLDVVRYADSNGFELDADRPNAWRYRDYVVNAFNSGKPYNRFIKEQIAGDEMYPGDPEALVATGYARAGSEHLVSGNIDPDESRQEVLTEIATNVGQTFLAMTVNCARCHNHKFDPILQADYYRLQAIFAGAKGKDVEFATPEQKAAWQAADTAFKARLKPVQDELKALAKPYEDRLRAAKVAALETTLRLAWETPEADRTAEQKTLAKDAKDQIGVTWDETLAAMTPADQSRRAALRLRLHEIEATAPDPAPAAYAYVNTGEPAPRSFVLRMATRTARSIPWSPRCPASSAPITGFRQRPAGAGWPSPTGWRRPKTRSPRA